MISGNLIPSKVLSLIQVVADQLSCAEGKALQHQAEVATVREEVTGRMIDVVVPESEPLLRLPDGPINLTPVIVGESGEPVGEMLIWVASGRLIGLEFPWYTEAPPDAWPDVSNLSFQ